MRNSLICAIESTTPCWWERVWILQEVVLAVVDPVFLFGPYVLDWIEVERFLKLAPESACSAQLMSGLAFLRQLKSNYMNGSITLRETMTLTRTAQARDNRDKVCSLLGFMSDSIREVLVPDYIISCKAVLKNALLACALEENCFVTFEANYPARSRSTHSILPTGALVYDSDYSPAWVGQMFDSGIDTASFLAGAIW